MLALAAFACAPPPLVVLEPDDTVAGTVTLATPERGERLWWSVDGGEWIDADTGLVLPTSSWRDGLHVVEVTSRSGLSRTASAQIAITTDNRAPALAIAEQSLAVEQGHTLPVVVRADEGGTFTLRFLDRDRPLHSLGDGRLRALVGVPIRAEPGDTPLILTATDRLGNTATYTVSVQVFAVDWPFSGKLPLSRREARVDPPAMVQMREERDAVYATHLPDALWTGPMRLPAAGRHTSAFGTFREYPDGKRSHHDAEDIARRRGVPILAAQAGTVALAKRQEVHGNAVLVHHGQGVVSLYSHLQRIAVEPGQAVQPGTLLGTMGSTGRSTGPHLHWGVVVDGIAVDPMQWLDLDLDLTPTVPLVPD